MNSMVIVFPYSYVRVYQAGYPHVAKIYIPRISHVTAVGFNPPTETIFGRNPPHEF